MHDGGLAGGNPDRSGTVAALPAIIAGLRDRGYEFVTVPEILDPQVCSAHSSVRDALFEKLAFPDEAILPGQTSARRHVRTQTALAFGALLGVRRLLRHHPQQAVLPRLRLRAALLPRLVHLRPDLPSCRLPLHIQYLEVGKALTFPYGVVPYVATAIPYVSSATGR